MDVEAEIIHLKLQVTKLAEAVELLVGVVRTINETGKMTDDWLDALTDDSTTLHDRVNFALSMIEPRTTEDGK